MSTSQVGIERRAPPLKGGSVTSHAARDLAEPLHPVYPLPFMQGYKATMYRDLHTEEPDTAGMSLGWLSWVAGALGRFVAYISQPVGLVMGIGAVCLGYRSFRRREGSMLTGSLLCALATLLALVMWVIQTTSGISAAFPGWRSIQVVRPAGASPPFPASGALMRV